MEELGGLGGREGHGEISGSGGDGGDCGDGGVWVRQWRRRIEHWEGAGLVGRAPADANDGRTPREMQC